MFRILLHISQFTVKLLCVVIPRAISAVNYCSEDSVAVLSTKHWDHRCSYVLIELAGTPLS